MNRRNALARIAAALAALVVAPRMLASHKPGSFYAKRADRTSYDLPGEWGCDHVFERRQREISAQLTRVSMSFWVPPWER